MASKNRNISTWNKLKVNYWGITKCGSSSTKTFLYQLENKVELDLKKHTAIHSSKYIDYITEEEALNNGYLNFTITRNPYQRFLSMYRDLVLSRPKKGKSAGLDSDINVDDFLDFISSNIDNKIDVHLQRQCSFITSDIKFYDLNNIENTWDLDFPFPSIIKHRSKNQKNIILTPNQKNKVFDLYREDFVRFKYSK